MKKQVFNPYLPLNEYVPDGEPYVFDGRVYIYGSHDEAGGSEYCPGNYVTWSAPADNLKEWRYEGEIYRRTQDPTNAENKLALWAPDVAKGTDGKYYIYYCFSFCPEIGVAVADSPAGPFEFYGHVKYPEDIRGGKTLNEYLPFDPGVLVDDDGRIYLYYGFAPADTNPNYPIVPSPGSMVVELEADMVTMKAEPKMCVPGAANAAGTGFEGHAFYEASSMRKVGGRYYFVYSSELSHELCYATSQYPDREFIYGGTIISNGDIGLDGNQTAVNMTGNNHGSIVQIGEDWYIFYHRQTHGTESSRQGCAEKITILPDGKILQAEITSCGLNGGPLEGRGRYPAAIACHLTGKADAGIIVFGQSRKEVQPYIYEEPAKDDGADGTEAAPVHYIANVTDGTVFGFKYFECEGLKEIGVTVRGNADGKLSVYTEKDGAEAGSTVFRICEDTQWNEIELKLEKECSGVLPLYFRYEGEGRLEVKEICLK